MLTFSKTMKNIMIECTRVVCGTLVLMSIFGLIGCAGYIESHYTMKAIVESVDGEEITFRDKTNNIWIAFGDGMVEGDSVTLVFEDNHTETREDDKIIDFKY